MKQFFLSGFCILLIAAVCGCHKKEEQSTQTTAPSEPSQAPAAGTNQNAGTAVAAAPAIDVNKALAETDAALKKREYEQAVATLLKLQQQRALTDQQSEAIRNEQIRLQQNLAGAAAGGDPKAKAAADMLRASSMHR